GFNAWGIRPPRLMVVGGGLDPLPQLPDPAGILAHYGLQTPFAMFVGRVNFDKGTIHAAQATLALRQTGIPLTLALAGRVAPDFARFYERLSPAERAAVRPLGVIGEVETHALLQAADLFLLPSRTESFGIVLLEAWIHGTPVIGANVGGVGSVVADGQDGLLVPFGDVPALQQAMRRLLEEPGLKQRLGEHGRQKVLSQYTWE